MVTDLGSSVETNTQKILVVDGDEIILRYLPVRFADCAVLTAKDARTALGLLEAHPDVSVLLADPQTSGYPLLDFCRTHFPRMQLVVMTRGPDRGRLGHTLRTLNKPCREAELVQALRLALSQAGTGDGGAPPAPSVFNEALEARIAEQTRALRQRTVELEALNRMKDELVMIAAHDIRAPLSVILGYTDILLESEPGISPNGESILHRIHAAANRLLSMVNNLLNLAAVEAGKVELTLTPCRMSDVVAGVVDSLAGMLEEQQVRCTTEILGPDLDYSVDRGRLEQVLQNLLANAVKFNHRGGTVHIAVTTGGDALHFSVQDSGRGFTEEQARRAFTKFSRFSAGANQGSGLGLAIAKALVQLHGGRIDLQSKPGAGSTFQFTILPGYKAAQDHLMLAP